MHFINYTYLLYLYTTHVVWQTKCEFVMCVTRVMRVFTGGHVHAKIVCNSVRAQQIFKFYMWAHACIDIQV